MRKFLPLVVILILASVLRFWDLAGNPPGLTWDEAAFGYNAYSIAQTGRDEYGNLLPLNLKSFGDYKPALYAYLTIPFVATLGLNEVAVRLPAVLFGIGLVFLTYLLINQLFNNKFLSLCCAFMMAISPWAIIFSRPAIEASVTLFLIVLGTLFYLKGLTKPPFLIFSAVSFAVGLFSYQSARLFIPILIFGLIIIYRKQIKYSRYLLLSAVILLVSGLLTAFLLFGLGQSNRLAAMNFFAYQRSVEEVNQIAFEDGLNKDNIHFQILHGEWWSYVRGLFERYFIYYAPKMLFVDGDYNPRHSLPDVGPLYYFSIVLVPLGIIYLLKYKKGNLIFFWLFTASLPAVFSRDLISLFRALNMVLPVIVLEGIGLYSLITILKQKTGRLFYVSIALLIMVIVFNFLIFLDQYFIHARREYSEFWLYGYKPMISDLMKIKDKYNKVVITDSWGQPYIYYLFYTKYPPADFQKQAVLDQPTVDVGTVRKIDNVDLRHIYWPSDRGLKNSLFVGTPDELPDQDVLPFKEFKTLGQINFLDGETAFRMVETR